MAILEVRGLTKEFGGLTAVNNVSFDLHENEILGLIGPNGAGKTTTFNMIAGSLAATRGSVKYNGVEILGKKSTEIANLGIARTFQITAIFHGLTVLQNDVVSTHRLQSANILDSLFYTKRYREEEAAIREKAMDVLEFVGIAHLADVVASNLPYGQQRLLEVAIALATEPQVVLFDEPAAGLNPEETRMFDNLVCRIRDRDISILMIEHNMRLVMGISDRIICLNYGTLLAEGSPEEVSSNPLVIEAYLGKGGEE